MKRRTRRLLQQADRLGAKGLTLAKGLRMEAKGLGRVFFEGGVPTWFPLEVRQ